MSTKSCILLVDDEERILRSLGLLLRMQYDVITTTEAHEALRILSEKDIDIVISDQRMPQMTGTEMLAQARLSSPRTVRILLTGYADTQATMDSVNEAEVFRYIQKPWGPKELRDTIAMAAEQARRSRQPVVVDPPISVKVVTSNLFSILVLDNDPQTLQTVRDIVGLRFPVLGVASVQAALAILAHHKIGILISELNLPGEDPATLIKTLKRERPSLLTLVITSFKDTRRVAELINQAQVYRYLPKPVRAGVLSKSLEATIHRKEFLQKQPEPLPEVDKIPELREQLNSSRMAAYLQKLRTRLLLTNHEQLS